MILASIAVSKIKLFGYATTIAPLVRYNDNSMAETVLIISTFYFWSIIPNTY